MLGPFVGLKVSPGRVGVGVVGAEEGLRVGDVDGLFVQGDSVGLIVGEPLRGARVSLAVGAREGVDEAGWAVGDEAGGRVPSAQTPPFGQYGPSIPTWCSGQSEAHMPSSTRNARSLHTLHWVGDRHNRQRLAPGAQFPDAGFLVGRHVGGLVGRWVGKSVGGGPVAVGCWVGGRVGAVLVGGSVGLPVGGRVGG